jgi:hypothetical protein
MFEADLKASLKSIFQLKRVTMDNMGDAVEQDILFINVENPRVRVVDGMVKARVTGECKIYSTAERMPFGYFAKKIKEADKDLTIDFFFSEIEENKKVYVNLVEKSFRFIWFWSKQYDPDLGVINEIEFLEGA